MHKQPRSNAPSAVGHLLFLTLVGWLVIAILPYVIAGAIACLAVWLLVRFHREILAVICWCGRLLAALAASFRRSSPPPARWQALPPPTNGQSGWQLRNGNRNGQP